MASRKRHRRRGHRRHDHRYHHPGHRGGRKRGLPTVVKVAGLMVAGGLVGYLAQPFLPPIVSGPSLGVMAAGLALDRPRLATYLASGTAGLVVTAIATTGPAQQAQRQVALLVPGGPKSAGNITAGSADVDKAKALVQGG